MSYLRGIALCAVRITNSLGHDNEKSMNFL
jgi:hypothetical protein